MVEPLANGSERRPAVSASSDGADLALQFEEPEHPEGDGEERRLAALARYRVFDEEPQVVFDDVVQLALAITGRPMGGFTLVEKHRQIFKARIGVSFAETGRDDAFCVHSIASDEVLVIADTIEDPRFAGHPMVMKPSGIRFYAAAPLRTIGDHQLIGSLCVFDTCPGDLTARERAALQALARNTMRHFQARQREAELVAVRRAQVRMEQAQRMETLGRFVGGVAHDFNNLLAVISLATDLLMERAEPRSVSAVSQIRSATDTAASITRQLLTFSRGGGEAHHVLEVNPVVDEMRPLLQRILGSSELRTALAEDLPMVIANRGLLERVLLNLVVNAVDAMGPGGVATVSTRRLTPECFADLGLGPPSSGAYVALSVGDNGHGMSPEVSERAFEPFFTTKGPGRGTGFGLSTVHGIASSLGGQAIIESALGSGTTVTIVLPAATENPPLPITETTQPRTNGERLLVVEDEDSLRDLVATILQSAGYHVLAAKGLMEANELCRGNANGVDLMLSDVVLRDGSGYDLLVDLRGACPAMRAVFISGHADAATAPETRPGRRARVLGKPFAPGALLATVREELDA
ncbi:MAG: Blue-light-activated protein [Acidimicrobiia bacterium]|nr:Blue-light-activated protein [Acidimicrobiia bacterium]